MIIPEDLGKQFIEYKKKGLSIKKIAEIYNMTKDVNLIGIYIRMNMNDYTDYKYNELKKRANKIIELLKDGDYDRDQITKILNIPRTTIYDTLKLLEMNNIVNRYSLETTKRGRPRIFWRLIDTEAVLTNEMFKKLTLIKLEKQMRKLVRKKMKAFLERNHKEYEELDDKINNLERFMKNNYIN
jgi:predicted ArsR family transcriptional regulator